MNKKNKFGLGNLIILIILSILYLANKRNWYDWTTIIYLSSLIGFHLINSAFSKKEVDDE
jgi:hypothetical protein